MSDPREYEGGNSDEKELLPEPGEDDLEQPEGAVERLPADDLPLNDGEEAIEEEDAG